MDRSSRQTSIHKGTTEIETDHNFSADTSLKIYILLLLPDSLTAVRHMANVSLHIPSTHTLDSSVIIDKFTTNDELLSSSPLTDNQECEKVYL